MMTFALIWTVLWTVTVYLSREDIKEVAEETVWMIKPEAVISFMLVYIFLTMPYALFLKLYEMYVIWKVDRMVKKICKKDGIDWEAHKRKNNGSNPS